MLTSLVRNASSSLKKPPKEIQATHLTREEHKKATKKKNEKEFA
jgi:hypothetical protein